MLGRKESLMQVLHPPAKCPQCGLVFPAKGFAIDPNVFGASFVGCGVNCPRCGAIAAVGDGVYSTPFGALQVENAPPLTLEMLKELRAIAVRARRDSLATEEIIAQVSGISPELAQRVQSKGFNTPALLILLFLLIKSCNTSGSVNFNDLIDQAWHISQGQDPDAHIDRMSEESEPQDTRPRPTPTKRASPTEVAPRQPRAPNRKERRKRASQQRKAPRPTRP